MATMEDIQFHYDVSDDLFRCFLDSKFMAYSCGVWDGARNLEASQERKFERMADFAHVNEGNVVLDVGCGWGGMLNYCLDVRGAARAIGLTLSRDQFEYVRAKNNSDISVHLTSWDTYGNHELFDAIVSIGAFEHFASLEDRKSHKQIAVYRRFFQKCFDMSSADAYVGLQTIITVKQPDSLQSVKDTRYLLRQVFPGSALPYLSDIQAAIHGLYKVLGLRTIGLDYVKTLSEWKSRLAGKSEYVCSIYGSRIYDHYMTYFDAARRSFKGGYVELAQMSLRKQAGEERFWRQEPEPHRRRYS